MLVLVNGTNEAETVGVGVVEKETGDTELVGVLVEDDDGEGVFEGDAPWDKELELEGVFVDEMVGLEENDGVPVAVGVGNAKMMLSAPPIVQEEVELQGTSATGVQLEVALLTIANTLLKTGGMLPPFKAADSAANCACVWTAMSCCIRVSRLRLDWPASIASVRVLWVVSFALLGITEFGLIKPSSIACMRRSGVLGRIICSVMFTDLSYTVISSSCSRRRGAVRATAEKTDGAFTVSTGSGSASETRLSWPYSSKIKRREIKPTVTVPCN